MRITKLLTIVLISALGFGQQNSVPLPSFDVPTPEAYAFQKNINIPVSHYTGIPSISVPIYNITSGDIAVPVALSYNAQGIRVDEIATRYGLGWNLQAGGAIVREVKDKVDEFNYLNPQSQNGYFNFDNIVNDQNKLVAFHDLYFSHITGSPIDLRPDVFSFNCGGLSGKFFFDQVTKQPVFQSFEDLKIEVIWNGLLMDGFIITDTQGTAYYFGKNKLKTITGIEKSEQISTEYYQFHNTENSTAGLHTGSVSGGDTRIKWDLLEIIDTKGNTITFTYDFEQLNHKKRLFDGKLGASNITEMAHSPIVSMYGRVNGLQRFLRKIEWKNGKVEFVSAASPRLDMGQPNTLSSISPKAIEYINVYDKKDNLITSHKLNFEYVENNDTSNTLSFYHNEPKKRLFLKSVQKTKENQVLNPYEFVYSDILLPNRFSNSIDFWGFYNGKSNGNSYYTGPASNDYSEHNNLAFFNNGGQEVDPVLCQAGLLKKVIYPTKGYSEYIYESNEAFSPDFMKRTVNTFRNPSIAKSASFFESNDFKVSPANAPWYSEVYETTPFFIGVRSFAISNNVHTYIYGNNQSGIGLEGTVPFDPSSGNDSQTGLPFNLQLYPVSGGGNPVAFNFPTFNLTRNTPGGTYKLKAQRIKEKQGELPEFAMAMHWREEITPSALKMIVGGNRIKQIVTVDNNNTQMTKRYDYNRFGTSISSGNLFGFESLYIKSGEAQGLQVMGISINEMNQTPTNHAGYSQVTEYIESANETHKTEYKFTNYVNEGEFFVYPLIPQTDNEWLRGKPLEVKYYKQNSPTDFSLLKETITSYNIPNFVGSGWEDSSYIEDLEQDNIIILNQQNSPKEYYYSIVKPFKRNDTDPDIGFTRNGEIYKFKHYYIGGGVMNVKSVIEREYLPSGVSETKTDFTYNSPLHNLPKEQKATNSKNQILETKYFYPQDTEMAGKPHVQDLINQHKIGTPLVTQSFRNTAKSSEQETQYRDWGNGIIAPEVIKTAKGAATAEVRIKYNALDNTTGNPLEVQQEGGQPITYIWGYYKTLPIAKIENATYAQVQQYEANLQTLSNGTDEASLITALNNLRTVLPNAMITTYTHKPLIGVSTMTDSKGNFVRYHYDPFNRLEFVTDKDDKIVSENKYHYKN